MMTNRTQPKSQRTQFLLTVLFGPLGLFYSSFPGAVLLLLAAVVLVKDFGNAGVLFVWPVAVATGFLTVRHWNRYAAEHGDTKPTSTSNATHA